MSGRSRGRANPNQDADEERRLWKAIKDKANEVDLMFARSNEIGAEILEVEMQQQALIEANKPSDTALDERLEQLYRDNVKLCEDAGAIIDGTSNEMNLLDSINILAGLREASEESASQMQSSQGPRAASGKLSRNPKKGGGAKNNHPVALSTEDGDEAAAAPSPRINLGAANRLSAKEKPSRSGSIATTREASVKIEDGAESVASSADGVSSVTGTSKTSAASNRATSRLVLKLGEIVLCKHDHKNYDAKKGGEKPDGEGYLCKVTNVIGEGKQRRYEVQDVDVEANATPQRVSIQQLFQVPESNKGLPDLSKGKHVLAQFPDTTTFYKAEVDENWTAKESSKNKQGELVVKLRFHEDTEDRKVERRLIVLER